MDLLATALIAAAATFVGCAAFWIPIGALIRRPRRDAVQLAAGLAAIAFLAVLAFGPLWEKTDPLEHAPKACSGRQC